jgi:hypothetical protein
MSVIPATWNAEVRRSTMQGQPEQKKNKVSKTQSKNWAWWCPSVIKALQEA